MFRDDIEEVIEATKWCWDHAIKIYPVISPIPSERPAGWRPAPMKATDKVSICVQIGSKTKIGELEYSQDDKLYEKIQELYLHYYNRRNK